MNRNWLLTIKPTFLHEANGISGKEGASIYKKLAQLVDDPTPDAKVKKQLKNWNGKLYRYRIGHYRVFYTLEAPYICVLALRKRDKDTYDEDLDPEFLGGMPSTPEDATTEGQQHSTPATTADPWVNWLSGPKPQGNQLPVTIDLALLESLKVPPQFHQALLAVGTEDALLDCPVPQDILSRVIDAVVGRPIDQVFHQPTLLVEDPEDLVRWHQGELLGFLLRLEPEQEKITRWAINSKGATLLKGGPGTGKSTIALYRVREILKTLLKNKVTNPRILFTTYTRALARVSEQLLTTLVGADGMKYVDVRTVDSALRPIAISAGAPTDLSKDVKKVLIKAMSEAKFTGSSLKIASQQETLKKLSRDFLLDEIQTVIEARALTSLEEYLAAARPGRRLALSKVQREVIWRVWEAYDRRLASERVTTPDGWRRIAADKIFSGSFQPVYDAVLVDEAQDLSPVAIRALVGLCKSAAGVFLAADANQSIYGGSFRWSDVHEWLKFTGRTSVIRSNHRSTKEIGEASNVYLHANGSGAQLDLPENDEKTRYVHSGPVPAVRAVTNVADEAKLIARFFRQATRSLKLGMGGCAVLAPSNDAASRIAADLTGMGLPAKKIDPKDLDLADPGVKVITLKSAKGLEFPIVAIAGFSDAPWPYLPDGAAEEEKQEIFERERRTLFVAMTRAMRALLVVIPHDNPPALLSGLNPPKWNDGTTEQNKEKS